MSAIAIVSPFQKVPPLSTRHRQSLRAGVSLLVLGVGLAASAGMARASSSNSTTISSDGVTAAALYQNTGAITGLLSNSGTAHGISNSGLIGTLSNSGVIGGNVPRSTIIEICGCAYSGSEYAGAGESNIVGISGISGTLAIIFGSGFDDLPVAFRGNLISSSFYTLVEMSISTNDTLYAISNLTKIVNYFDYASPQPYIAATGISNVGTISVLSNAGVVAGSLSGIMNSGTIDSLYNSGSIYGGASGIHSSGTIKNIINSGIITGMTLES